MSSGLSIMTPILPRHGVATTRTIFIDDRRRLACWGSAGYFPVQGRNMLVAFRGQSGSTKNRL
jgi:hypothetical protein